MWESRAHVGTESRSEWVRAAGRDCEAGLLAGSELKAQTLPERHGVWLEVFSREQQDHM